MEGGIRPHIIPPKWIFWIRPWCVCVCVCVCGYITLVTTSMLAILDLLFPHGFPLYYYTILYYFIFVLRGGAETVKQCFILLK